MGVVGILREPLGKLRDQLPDPFRSNATRCRCRTGFAAHQSDAGVVGPLGSTNEEVEPPAADERQTKKRRGKGRLCPCCWPDSGGTLPIFLGLGENSGAKLVERCGIRGGVDAAGAVVGFELRPLSLECRDHRVAVRKARGVAHSPQERPEDERQHCDCGDTAQNDPTRHDDGS
ncbi:hypothetical protein JCM16106_11600 [Hydrogenophilus islandicus]